MAWEWSHTQEAYDNALNNLDNFETDELLTIASEWAAWDGEDGFDEGKYYKALKDLRNRRSRLVKRNMTHGFREGLIDDIWNHMSEFRTSDNGGYNAWACPYGCHTVSFDSDNTEEIDNESLSSKVVKNAKRLNESLFGLGLASILFRAEKTIKSDLDVDLTEEQKNDLLTGKVISSTVSAKIFYNREEDRVNFLYDYHSGDKGRIKKVRFYVDSSGEKKSY